MDKKLDSKLVKDFPLLYADRHKNMQETCMCWGFPNDGWEPLIRDLSEKLEPMIQKWIDENLDDRENHPRASQVKEKFGTLRFYMTKQTEEMSIAIREAEAQSEITCERCVGEGTRRGGGWIRTLCQKCEDAYQKEKYNRVP